MKNFKLFIISSIPKPFDEFFCIEIFSSQFNVQNKYVVDEIVIWFMTVPFMRGSNPERNF